jgi:cell division protein FtsQ
MTNGYYYAEEAAVSGSSSKLEKMLKRVVVVAAALFGLELLWLLGVTPFMPLARVEVNGLETLNTALQSRLSGQALQDIIVTQAGISPGTSYVSLDTARAENALEEMDGVASARVFKYYPDRAVINIESRRAVGVSLGTLKGRTVPVAFDRDGVVIKTGGMGESPADGWAGMKSLPLISGIAFENPAPGMRVPALFNQVLEELETIERNAPELLQAISEIQMVRKSFDGFEIILYPVNSRVKVRLGPELNEDLLRYSLLMLDVVNAGNAEIDTLDFRTGMASYTLKEVSSE